MGARDRTTPKGQWKFDGAVTKAFDDMLERSIPQYEVMRRAVTDLAVEYAGSLPGGAVVDLGCSRGEALSRVLAALGPSHHYVGLEVSRPMLEASRERFSGEIAHGVVEVVSMDLRRSFHTHRSSVTLSVLTLQFVPIEYRHRVVSDVYQSLLPGGALVLVEKVLGNTHGINEKMVGLYHAMKSEHGYDQEAIQRKALSLEGVLVPVAASWNEDLLRRAGFRDVDCFWRWMNFAGWVAVKG